MSPSLDVLAFAAHPDDLEIICGGTLVKLARAGRRVGMIDLTRGELGSRGTVEIRERELRAAQRVIGAKVRETLDLPDGFVANDGEARKRVVAAIRRHRPRLVIAQPGHDRHPDHEACGAIVQDAFFLAGLKNYPAPGAPHRPHKLIFPVTGRSPQAIFAQRNCFFVDVTEQMDRKLKAVACHASQFPRRDPRRAGLAPRFDVFEFIRARNRFYGTLIRAAYAEAFYQNEAFAVENPLELSVPSM